jgi:hypothetical protein
MHRGGDDAGNNGVWRLAVYCVVAYKLLCALIMLAIENAAEWAPIRALRRYFYLPNRARLHTERPHHRMLVEHDPDMDERLCQVCFTNTGVRSLSTLRSGQVDRFMRGEERLSLLTLTELREVHRLILKSERLLSRDSSAALAPLGLSMLRFDVLVASACGNTDHAVCLSCLTRAGSIALTRCICSYECVGGHTHAQLPPELKRVRLHDWVRNLGPSGMASFAEDLVREPLQSVVSVPCPTCGMALEKTLNCNSLHHCGDWNVCWLCGEPFPGNDISHWSRYGCWQTDRVTRANEACTDACTLDGTTTCLDPKHACARARYEARRRQFLLQRFERVVPRFIAESNGGAEYDGYELDHAQVVRAWIRAILVL